MIRGSRQSPSNTTYSSCGPPIGTLGDSSTDRFLIHWRKDSGFETPKFPSPMKPAHRLFIRPVFASKLPVAMNTTNDLERHLLATLAYRAAKVLREVPPSFATFSGGPGMRTPVHILAHLGDLMAWAMRMVQGEMVWRPEGTED